MIILLAVFAASCAKQEPSDKDFSSEKLNAGDITVDFPSGRDIHFTGELSHSELDYFVKENLQDITEVDLQEISSFKTPLLDKSESRIKNIKLASDKLDNHKIAPGEEFSFNKVVGKRTEEKGYKLAPIIISSPDGPKSSNDIGGGICQLSSTLYNAVKKAGLKVTERHPHSKKVSYVKKGLDATIDFNRYDFKFINTRAHSITLKIDLKEDTLTVKVFENKERER